MKRIFLLCLTALFALTTWAGSSDKYDFSVDGIYYYKLSDGSVAVIDSAYQKVTSTYAGDLVIPSSVTNPDDGNTYTVSSIFEWAFYKCEITTLDIPESVTSFGEAVFYDCEQLKELTIPDGMTSVPNSLCFQCYALTSVTIPNTVTSIETSAFSSCSSLTDVTIPSGVTEIGNSAFLGCTSLTEIVIPKGVTSLGRMSFGNCQSLSKIYFLGSTPPSFGLQEFASDSETIYVPIGSLSAYETALSSQTYSAIKEFAEIDIVVADSENDGYATFYHGTYDITLPDGVKAYYASDVKDGEVTLTEVEGTIPAGNAVLVEGSIADYYLDAAEATSSTTLSGNMLYGSDTDTETTVDGSTDGYYFYKLSTVNGENLGFYWGAEDGGKFEIAAHKAWLAVPTTEGTRALSFKKGEADTTGITSVEVENEANAVSGIYTLQGVRVSDMNQKGVYIVDGKKVLVK